MSCPNKVNSNTIELIKHTSCYCVLDLLCVTCKLKNLKNFQILVPYLPKLNKNDLIFTVCKN